MAIEDDNDRDTMLVDGGVSATYNGTATITVLFDDAYFEDGVGDGAGVDSSAPAALAKTSDVSGATIGSTLVIGGTTYHVTSVQPDGQGMTRLVLEKQ